MFQLCHIAWGSGMLLGNGLEDAQSDLHHFTAVVHPAVPPSREDATIAPLCATYAAHRACHGLKVAGGGQSTSPAQQFRSPATLSTGIAIVNRYTGATVPIGISAIHASGNVLATSTFSLSPMTHQSYNVGQLFPKLPSTFKGSVSIFNNSPLANEFVAWAVSADSGFLSSYPPSGLNWPVSQYERIWRVWQKVLNVAVVNYPLGTPPQLVVDYNTSTINSFADPARNQVHIFMNLAELISDSESELAFAVAHELGHIIQAKVGLLFISSNKEYDADAYGLLLPLIAGYDPYGAAGALAKLAMASGGAGLVDQNFDNFIAAVGLDLHGSFNNRLALIFDEMELICATPQGRSFCLQYKALIHPHFPSLAPLGPEQHH